MFHKAISLKLLEGTSLEVQFQDGIVKQFDMAVLFSKYPQMRALLSRPLFLSGRLSGSYGIIWNEDLDIDTETVYESGVTVGRTQIPGVISSEAVLRARAEKGWSQKELAKKSGIDQADISRIERGLANPSVQTLSRIADALGGQLHLSIDFYP